MNAQGNHHKRAQRDSWLTARAAPMLPADDDVPVGYRPRRSLPGPQRPGLTGPDAALHSPLTGRVEGQEGTQGWTHHEARAEGWRPPHEDGLCTPTLASEPLLRSGAQRQSLPSRRKGWETRPSGFGRLCSSSAAACVSQVEQQTGRLAKPPLVSLNLLVFHSCKSYFPLTRNTTWQRILCKEETEIFPEQKGKASC